MKCRMQTWRRWRFFCDGSDSAMFDNCLELLTLAGRSLPHAMMMMIPEPWANHESMSAEKKAFYEYTPRISNPFA